MIKKLKKKQRRSLVISHRAWLTHGDGSDCERGDVLVIFVLSLMALVFFVGLTVDVSAAMGQKNHLNDMAQITKNSRYAFQDSVRYSANPGATFAQCAQKTLAENGYAGAGTIYFEETVSHDNKRVIKMRVTLSEDAPTYFFKIFGVNSFAVSASASAQDTYGEGGDDVVWHPNAAPSSYSGAYKFSNPGASASFVSGSFPSDW